MQLMHLAASTIKNSSSLHIQPLLLKCHGSVMTTDDTRCRAVLKEFLYGFDLTELGREFQSVIVLWKKKICRHQYMTA